MFPFHLSSS